MTTRTLLMGCQKVCSTERKAETIHQSMLKLAIAHVQFDAVEEKEVRQVSNAAALSPSPLSPLSLSSTPMGPSRTTSGMSNVTADSHLALKGPSLVRPVTPLSPLGLPLSGAAQ